MSNSEESCSDDVDDIGEEDASIMSEYGTDKNAKAKGSYLKTKGARKRKTTELQNPQHGGRKAKKPRPVSTEEINTLFETENLYHSHLFRMQLEELIKETRYKSSETLDEWLDKLKSTVSSVSGKKISLLLNEDAFEDVMVPMEKSGKFAGKFKNWRVHNVVVGGSHALNTAIGKDTTVDIFAALRESDFCPEDMSNHTWMRKKALFLTCLATHLRKRESQKSLSCSSIRFSYEQGNPLRPCLLVKPAGTFEHNVQYQIIPVIQRTELSWRKLGPNSSNVQTEWFFGSERNEGATPLYNSSILQDLVWEETVELCKSVCNEGEPIRDSIKLLKLWLQQRELSQGLGGFSGHLMTIVVCYLVQKNGINPRMSNYQILRNVWNFIGNSNWETEGISLCSKKHKIPEITSFPGVKVIDPTGYLNYAAHLLPHVYEQVREESRRALEYLKLDSINSFEALFMSRVPFSRKHDIILRLESSSGWKDEMKKLNLEDEWLDMGSACGYVAVKSVISLLRRGLGSRISSFGVKLKNNCWDVDKSPPSVSEDPVYLGLVLDSAHAFNKLVMGAEANSIEAVYFKELWGELSQLRRFRDGGIHEAVLWDAKTIYDKRYITSRAASYLLDLHVGVTTKVEANSELLDVLDRPSVKTTWSYNSGEEAAIKAKAALDSLSTEIRTLTDLPLQISSVSGTCPSSRYCQVFPQLPSASKLDNPITKVRNGHTYLSNPMMSPPWLQPIKVQVMLESSGKWPDDLGAIRRVKAAFHLEIAKALKAQLKLLAQPYPDKVSIVKDGYIFDVYVAHLKEISLLRQTSSDSKTENVKLSKVRALERKLVHLPKISSSLSGLHNQSGHCFGTCCRLAKRWLGSQLVLDHVGEMTVELLVASLFTSTQPYPSQPPVSPVAAFLRLLSLLAHTDFQSTPIIVNFNDELSKDEVTDIHQQFIGSRENLPSLFIATPHEHVDSVWTLDKPSAVVLHRVKQLASQALIQVEKEAKTDWPAIFRPPMSVYDVQIHLRSVHLPRWHQALTVSKSKVLVDSSSDYSVLPVCEYDPAQLYLQELEDSFSDLALFFHDRFGGSVIGVLWKPSALASTEFKVSNLAWRCPSGTTVKNEYGLSPNFEAVLDDFRTLGKGLVKSIEIKH